jgi:hypothetical protein
MDVESLLNDDIDAETAPLLVHMQGLRCVSCCRSYQTMDNDRRARISAPMPYTHMPSSPALLFATPSRPSSPLPYSHLERASSDDRNRFTELSTPSYNDLAASQMRSPSDSFHSKFPPSLGSRPETDYAQGSSRMLESNIHTSFGRGRAASLSDRLSSLSIPTMSEMRGRVAEPLSSSFVGGSTASSGSARNIAGLSQFVPIDSPAGSDVSCLNADAHKYC